MSSAGLGVARKSMSADRVYPVNIDKNKSTTTVTTVSSFLDDILPMQNVEMRTSRTIITLNIEIYLHLKTIVPGIVARCEH